MKKVKINGFVWFYNKSLNQLFEYEDSKHGVSINKLTPNEVEQLHTWLYYNGIPM